MFIYFDLLATILDEPKSGKHGWNFFAFFEKCAVEPRSIFSDTISDVKWFLMKRLIFHR
jgi:hypothetical protein